MARRRSPIPSYRCHGASGNAVVTITDTSGRRRDIYLGKYGSDSSKVEYARVIAQWQATRLQPFATGDLTIAELLLAYFRFAENHYGAESGEMGEIKRVIKLVRTLFGSTLASEFGPRAFKIVRQHMVESGLSRGVVNQRCGRIRRLVRWAVGEELLPPSAYHGLQAVPGLQRGRSGATETEPIKPVPDTHVEATLPHLLSPVAAMVQVQRLTGARPGEVCVMRMCDIDTSGPTWLYRPTKHKGQWRGRGRVIAIGPKAQAIIRKLDDSDPLAFVFSPKRALAEQAAVKRAARRSKVQPSQRVRKKRNPKKFPGDRYSTHSYNAAVAKAAIKAGVPHWHPNQLRHSRATEVRKHFGLEAAQHVLGHATADITQVYAESDVAIAIRVASKSG